jgi:hypothetical protein
LTQGASSASTGVVVPWTSTPAIDGVVREDEWRGARVIALRDGGELRLMHDGRQIHVGLSRLPGAGVGWGCLFIGQAGVVKVLHASARLGSARYTAGRDGRWAPESKTYTWKPADQMLREEGWMANVSQDTGASGREYALSFTLLRLPPPTGTAPSTLVGPARIALAYVYATGRRKDEFALAVWPDEAQDAIRERRLLDGFNPSDLVFAPATWATLTPERRER